MVALRAPAAECFAGGCPAGFAECFTDAHVTDRFPAGFATCFADRWVADSPA